MRLAVIAAHGRLAVGHVGRLKPFVVRVRHFDTRSHPAAAVERLRSGVAHLNAIHVHEVVVDAAHQRIGRGCPYPVGILAHGILLAADIDDDFLCLWGM